MSQPLAVPVSPSRTCRNMHRTMQRRRRAQKGAQKDSTHCVDLFSLCIRRSRKLSPLSCVPSRSHRTLSLSQAPGKSRGQSERACFAYNSAAAADVPAFSHPTSHPDATQPQSPSPPLRRHRLPSATDPSTTGTEAAPASLHALTPLPSAAAGCACYLSLVFSSAGEHVLCLWPVRPCRLRPAPP